MNLKKVNWWLVAVYLTIFMVISSNGINLYEARKYGAFTEALRTASLSFNQASMRCLPRIDEE